MSGLVDRVLHLPPLPVYLVVTLLVYIEDALFVGFVVPGESAAVLGGVVASQGRVNVVLLAALVVLAAITGDSTGYEIGRHFGPRILDLKILEKRREKLDNAQDFLRRRGGSAVFLGRFVAFFRAVMPALAGMSRMPYLRFLTFNSLGGLVWGIGFVLVGYLAGASYKVVEKDIGTGAAVVVAVVVVAFFIVHKVREGRSETSGATE